MRALVGSLSKSDDENQDGDSRGASCRSSLFYRFSRFQTFRIDQTIVLSMEMPLAKRADVSKVVN